MKKYYIHYGIAGLLLVFVGMELAAGMRDQGVMMVAGGIVIAVANIVIGNRLRNRDKQNSR